MPVGFPTNYSDNPAERLAALLKAQDEDLEDKEVDKQEAVVDSALLSKIEYAEPTEKSLEVTYSFVDKPIKAQENSALADMQVLHLEEGADKDSPLIFVPFLPHHNLDNAVLLDPKTSLIHGIHGNAAAKELERNPTATHRIKDANGMIREGVKYGGTLSKEQCKIFFTTFFTQQVAFNALQAQRAERERQQEEQKKLAEKSAEQSYEINEGVKRAYVNAESNKNMLLEQQQEMFRLYKEMARVMAKYSAKTTESPLLTQEYHLQIDRKIERLTKVTLQKLDDIDKQVEKRMILEGQIANILNKVEALSNQSETSVEMQVAGGQEGVRVDKEIQPAVNHVKYRSTSRSIQRVSNPELFDNRPTALGEHPPIQAIKVH